MRPGRVGLAGRDALDCEPRVEREQQRVELPVVRCLYPDLEIEIVKRSDRSKGFVVQPRRWVVERTIAWLNRCRRLARDWENLNRNALAFLKLASIRLMLRKLCNPL